MRESFDRLLDAIAELAYAKRTEVFMSIVVTVIGALAVGFMLIWLLHQVRAAFGLQGVQSNARRGPGGRRVSGRPVSEMQKNVHLRGPGDSAKLQTEQAIRCHNVPLYVLQAGIQDVLRS